ncbi:hypothetical protein [Anaerostipes sp. Marseille-Q3525]|uniref:hypothetical protein n=1 Tax=Anaerostipes sp. Marseille-Q3525 TaxID=2758418 RepID=UPI001BADFAD3|nr:hypothetical protein [Anaerostipes sp. Marseille-Q3525]MBR9960488.1 hypothetical protein [Anaerostipes sp. Marseille-Q3525]
MFVMLLLPGLVQGAQPKNIDRVKKTFRLLLISCVSGSFLIWLICMISPAAVSSIFTNDMDLIAYTNKSMRVYLAMLLIYGIQVACQYSFVALDQAEPIADMIAVCTTGPMFYVYYRKLE